MSPSHFVWESSGSTLRPITLVLRFSNSGFRAATRPSSVVHTGVKSLGCEKSTAQLSPFHSWNEIVPWVVSAVKSGASSPSRIAMVVLPCSSSGPAFSAFPAAYRARANCRPAGSGFGSAGADDLLAQLALQDLALGVAGQRLGADVDADRDLERGQVAG